MALSQLRIYGPVTTAERDAMVSGGNTVPTYTMVFNSTTGQFEFYTGSAWQAVPGSHPTFIGATIGFLGTDGLTVIERLNMQTGTFAAVQGSDVASANNLALGAGNVFEITGATQIDLIKSLVGPTAQQGLTITLLFTSTPTVKHGQATSGLNTTILLNGSVDFVASAGATLTLCYCEIGGTNAWREQGRMVP